MDGIIQHELEMLMNFEHVRMTAEGNYLNDPTDTDNLTNWGGALVSLSQYGDRYPYEMKKILREAVSKLEEALTINPAKHEALFLLGKAHIYCARLADDFDKAKNLFDEARQRFQKAVDESPEDVVYQQFLADCTTGPRLRHGGRAANATGPANIKYDICGWVIFSGLLTWMLLVR